MNRSILKSEFSKNYIIIFIFFIAMLMQQAWVPGFFHDGYLYAAFGKNAAEFGNWLVPHASDSQYSRFFHHLPFVFMLEGLFFKLFGASYLTARIFASLFTLTTFIILFKMTYKENKYWAYFTCIVFVLIPPLLKKSRFPNLDLPLMLFVLCSGYFYLKALVSKRFIHWLLTGLFFGFCILTKGPMAIFVPMSIVFHLILERKTNLLLTIKPWLGLLFGFVIFAIWPVLLYSTNNGDVFENYIRFTFLDTIRDSRGTGSPVYTYFWFLLKQTSLWFMLVIFTIIQIVKKKYQSTNLNWFLSLFLSVLFLLSLFKFKYSHYLIPLYPALAALAGYSISKMSKNFLDNFPKYFNSLAIITILLFLIFPLTTKIRRDREIFKIRQTIQLLQYEVPKNWAIVDNIYPFWSLHNLNSFEDHSNTYSFSNEWLGELKNRKSWGILIPAVVYNSNEKIINAGFLKLLCFEKRNMFFLIHRSLINKK